MRNLYAERHRRRRDRTRLFAQRLAREAVRGAINHRRWFRPWRNIERQQGESLDALGDYSLALVLSGARPKCPHGSMGCMCFKARGLGRPIMERRDLESYRRNVSPSMKRLLHHLRQRLRRK